MDSERQHFFIACHPLVGVKIKKLGSKLLQPKEIQIEMGSLLKTLDRLSQFQLKTSGIEIFKDNLSIPVQTCDTRDVYTASQIDFMEEITESVVDLLIAEPDPQLRWKFYRAHKGEDLVPLAQAIEVGMSVFYVGENDQKLPGIVKFAGELQGTPKMGFQYGIQLENKFNRVANTDGTIGNVEFFRAPRNSSVFAPITRVKLFQERGVNRSDEFKSLSRSRGLVTDGHLTNGAECSYNSHISDETSLSEGQIVCGDLTVGDRVVWINDENKNELATVRWIGHLPDKKEGVYAGVEFDNPIGNGTGVYLNRQLFYSRPHHASFVPILGLIKESELAMEENKNDLVPKPTAKFYVPLPSSTRKQPNFGPIDSGVVVNYIAPLVKAPLDNVTGLNRGIQGYQNSCYLDASLFAMFAFSDSFDRLLLRKCRPSDIPEYNIFVEILASEIVYPLRKGLFVRADRVMKLRKLLSQLLYDVPGLVDGEKDPEEVFTDLFKKVLKVEPFLSLHSRTLQLRDSYFCQLVIDEKLDLSFPSVQQLMESSFFDQGVKFTKVPQNLIVHVPRYGRTKIYPFVFPNLELDLTHLIQQRPRPCALCGKVAVVECSECFLTRSFSSMDDITYCQSCFNERHNRGKFGVEHGCKGIAVSEFSRFYDRHPNAPIVRTKLALSAVLCIETSHYVAYVKSGWEDSRPWLFFDSMANREGEEDGYCIPEISLCPDLQMLLRDENFTKLKADVDLGNRNLPPYLMRLVKDAYVCFYENRMIPN